MRLLVLSDLHLEFHRDGGRALIGSLPNDVDAVVVPGDLATVSSLKLGISLLCERFPQVITTYGNHEFYGSTRGAVLELVKKIRHKHPNFHPLENEVLELGGKRFVGTPLWYSKVPPKYEQGWSDFRWIVNFRQWVYKENAKSEAFLNAEVRKGDIVLTHFLPTGKSVHASWQGNPTNCFFVHDMEPLILQREPALWIHGHTHESMDYTLGNTRVVCNPFGYVGHMLNAAFIDNYIIDV